MDHLRKENHTHCNFRLIFLQTCENLHRCSYSLLHHDKEQLIPEHRKWKSEGQTIAQPRHSESTLRILKYATMTLQALISKRLLIVTKSSAVLKFSSKTLKTAQCTHIKATHVTSIVAQNSDNCFKNGQYSKCTANNLFSKQAKAYLKALKTIYIFETNNTWYSQNKLMYNIERCTGKMSMVARFSLKESFQFCCSKWNILRHWYFSYKFLWIILWPTIEALWLPII